MQVASYQAERFGLRAGGALDARAVPETNPVWSDSEMSVDSGRREASGESKEGEITQEDSNRFDGRRVGGWADEDVTQAQRTTTADWCMTSSSFVDEGPALQWATGDMSTGGLSWQVGGGARRPLEESDTELRQKAKVDTEPARAGTGLRQLRQLGPDCAGGAVNLEDHAVANAALRARVLVSLSLSRALSPREERRGRE